MKERNLKKKKKKKKKEEIQGVKRGKYSDKLKLLLNFSPKLLTPAVMWTM